MQFASRPQAVAKGVIGRRFMRFMRPLPRALGTFLLGLMGLAELPAQAQLRVDISGGLSAPMPNAIPVMPTPQPESTPAGPTADTGHQVSQGDSKRVLYGKSVPVRVQLGGPRQLHTKNTTNPQRHTRRLELT